MTNLNDLQNSGIEIQQFCGIPVEQTDDGITICSQEAIGELTAVLEDGTVVPVPICQDCLNTMFQDFKIEEVDTTGGTLLQ